MFVQAAQVLMINMKRNRSYLGEWLANIETRRHRVAIVALTAFTDAESHQRAIAAGCLSVCTKPCDPAELLFAINVVLGGAPA